MMMDECSPNFYRFCDKRRRAVIFSYLVCPSGDEESRLLPFHIFAQLQPLALHPQPELGGLTACGLSNTSVTALLSKQQVLDPQRLPRCDCLCLGWVSVSGEHPRLELCKHLLPGPSHHRLTTSGTARPPWGGSRCLLCALSISSCRPQSPSAVAVVPPTAQRPSESDRHCPCNPPGLLAHTPFLGQPPFLVI